jgi:hypothetical protein
MGTVPVTLALAGCNAGYDGPVRTEAEETPSATETASPTATSRPTPEGFWRVVSIEEQDTVADRHRVSLRATMGEPWVTTEHKAWVAVTLTNHASHVRTFHGFADPDVKRGLFNDEGAVLGDGSFDDEGADLVSLTGPPECIGTDGKRPGPFGVGPGVWERELEAGESLTGVFGVFDDSRISGCISPGTYRFGWRITYKDAPPNEEEEDGRTSWAPIRWGLTLRITAPE